MSTFLPCSHSVAERFRESTWCPHSYLALIALLSTRQNLHDVHISLPLLCYFGLCPVSRAWLLALYCLFSQTVQTYKQKLCKHTNHKSMQAIHHTRLRKNTKWYKSTNYSNHTNSGGSFLAYEDFGRMFNNWHSYRPDQHMSTLRQHCHE